MAIGLQARRSSPSDLANAWLIRACLALIPALSGTTRGLFVPGLKISDILALLLLIAVLVRWRGRWRLTDSLGVALLVYALLFAVLTLGNFSSRTDLPADGLAKELLSVPQYLLLYLLAYGIGQHTARVSTWFTPSLLVAASLSALAVAQLLDVGPTRAFISTLTGNPELLDHPTWKVYRATALFPSWHALAMYLSIHIILAIALIVKGHPGLRERQVLVVGAALACVGILTTSTATPIVMAVAGVAVITYSARRVRYLVLLGAVGAAVALFTPVSTLIAERVARQAIGGGDSLLLPQTIGFRLEVWSRDYLPLIEDNPWSGYGPLSERDLELFPYTESMYISALLMGGIPLLVTVLLLLLVAARRMTQVASRARSSSLVAMATGQRFVVFGLLFALLLHPYLDDAGSAALFFIALGMVSGAAEKENAPQIGRERTTCQSRRELRQQLTVRPIGPVTARPRHPPPFGG